uniref:Retrotransposon protein, putative, Ty3-gypsy subclass n=1 Tax=Tanacetum cinerariifolium TaxID=118510 RepID=A0A6L2J065_TANCI|nr:retrotransposon protein, putative, Ty3-gypsy subclass [Tanacetum cinerariifolium]
MFLNRESKWIKKRFKPFATGRYPDPFSKSEAFTVSLLSTVVGIGAVLSQMNRPIAYFSEKLNDAKRRYSTYDKEFYAIIRALDHWQHYLISKEFILHFDHEALKYIQGQHKLQPRHAKWVEFLQAFTFTIKHKSGKFNKEANALSCKYSLISSLQPKLIGFEPLQNEYPSDPDFGEIYANCLTHAKAIFISPDWAVMLNIISGDAFRVIRLKVILLHMAQNSSSVPRATPKLTVRLNTNRTLGSLLRALVSSNLKQWEDLLPRAEFAYNRAPSKTTGINPFMAVYGLNPTTPLDLVVLDTSTKFDKEASDSDVAADIKSIHQRIHDKIVKTNELKYRRDKGRKHVLFKPGDLVWLHFRKERSPSKRRSKLSPWSDGPFKVLAKVNDNAYEIELPGDSSASATINVADL